MTYLSKRGAGPGEVRIDVIPAGPELLARGFVEWPSGQRMSLTGLAHAFEHESDLTLGDGLVLKVATLPVIALLKMVAYLDRPAERRHDLDDLAFLLEEYLAPDDDRRWSDEIIAEQVSFELASAYALGRDIGSFAVESDRAVIAAFGDAARANRFSTLTAMAERAPRGWRNDEDESLARVEALQAGLRGSPSSRE